jgi:DNA-binding response OmpR family regulator
MTGKKKILVVDDDPDLCQLAADILEENGYLPIIASSTDEAFKKLREHPPALIVLDVWLPSIGGLAFCRQVRQDEKVRHIPIIMLTVQDKETDKVLGLEMGADDYMTKPFSQKELLARIQALLRRFDRSVPVVNVLESGDLVIDLDRHTVNIKGKSLDMTPKGFDLIVALLKNKGKALSRQALLSSVWGPDSTSTATIDVHIRYLRKKIGAHGDKIKTILGFGYRFDG